ncbi:hypothetical protein RJ641_029205 [Dillenia turbinata]|uniref:Uncharacterized protein n=1 Tax=Dillenia turbinata TaxID=194707 RepID=A0AAN8ZG27_9MAGN
MKHDQQFPNIYELKLLLRLQIGQCLLSSTIQVQSFEWERMRKEEIDMKEGTGLAIHKAKPFEALRCAQPRQARLAFFPNFEATVGVLSKFLYDKTLIMISQGFHNMDNERQILYVPKNQAYIQLNKKNVHQT